jgi:hypothetical protein
MFYINTQLRYPPRKKSAARLWGFGFLALSTPLLVLRFVRLVWVWVWVVAKGLGWVGGFVLHFVLVVVWWVVLLFVYG